MDHFFLLSDSSPSSSSLLPCRNVFYFLSSRELNNINNNNYYINYNNTYCTSIITPAPTNTAPTNTVPTTVAPADAPAGAPAAGAPAAPAPAAGAPAAPAATHSKCPLLLRQRYRTTNLVTTKRLICQNMAIRNIPYHIKKERQCPGLHLFDKIFASLWYDSNNIVAGTKDNKLVVWNVGDNPISYRVIDLPRSNTPQPPTNCGVHSIAISPSQSYIVSGADNPCDLALFELPSYTPTMILTGHKDWSFCAEFLSEDRVISGSRDCTVRMWSVSRSEDEFSRDPLITKTEHNGKVRSLVVNRGAGYFCTLGVEGTIKTWDSTTFAVTKTTNLVENQELVCLAIHKQNEIIAVGSQCHISLYCQRSGTNITTITSHDGDWGVRSLSFQNDLITIGGGAGRMAFYDMRKNSFLKVESPVDDPTLQSNFFLEMGQGWLEKDANYERHFSGLNIPQAIYTHCYDPNSTRLFVGGGPLMLGLKGSYAGIWW